MEGGFARALYSFGLWSRGTRSHGIGVAPPQLHGVLYCRGAVHSHATQWETRMTTLFRISLVVMCLAMSNLLGQTIQITDDTAKDSPVTVKGTITFDPNDRDNRTCSITGHNHTDRMIVAFTMIVNATKPDGELAPEMHILRDLFLLDPAMLAKRAPQPQMDFPVFELNTHCGGGVYSGTRRIPIPKPPEAHIKFAFVQFDDGSVRGDDQAVAEAMFQRTETVKYLQSLRDAYSDGGDYALYQALRAPQATNPDHRHRFMASGIRQRLLKLDSARAAADRIDEDLATAEEHVAWLK